MIEISANPSNANMQVMNKIASHIAGSDVSCSIGNEIMRLASS